MNVLLVLPILLPLVTAALMLLAYRSALVQRLMGLVSSVLQLGAALWLLGVVNQKGIVAVQMGGWQAPFGITLVADMLAVLMLTLSGIIAVITSIYSIGDIDRERRVYGFYPLAQLLLLGVNGAFLTGDLFNLYVWFEVLLIASFVLLVLGNERQQMEGAIKYLTLNLIASAIFLAAVGIVYGSVHALNMADLSLKLASPDVPRPIVHTLAMLFFVAFGIKAAVFPLFFWLPDSYHTPPVTVTALFAALLTKVGVYAMLRIFSLLFGGDGDTLQPLLMVVAALTMVLGVLGAMAQMSFRRVLAFHSVSQVGYMVMGIALMSAGGLAAGIFFMLHHSLVKSNLFLISGLVQREAGTTMLKKLGNGIARMPVAAWLFLLSALSLAGLPPFSGFWAKLGLVKAAFATDTSGGIALAGVALVVGMGTLISMTKIWNEAFWKPQPDDAPPAPVPMSLARRTMHYLPVLLLSAVVLLLGLWPEPVLELANEAGRQLATPSEYVNAVLGEHAHARPGP